jgi:hypothetical protein
MQAKRREMGQRSQVTTVEAVGRSAVMFILIMHVWYERVVVHRGHRWRGNPVVQPLTPLLFRFIKQSSENSQLSHKDKQFSSLCRLNQDQSGPTRNPPSADPRRIPPSPLKNQMKPGKEGRMPYLSSLLTPEAR